MKTMSEVPNPSMRPGDGRHMSLVTAGTVLIFLVRGSILKVTKYCSDGIQSNCGDELL